MAISTAVAVAPAILITHLPAVNGWTTIGRWADVQSALMVAISAAFSSVGAARKAGLKQVAEEREGGVIFRLNLICDAL